MSTRAQRIAAACAPESTIDVEEHAQAVLDTLAELERMSSEQRRKLQKSGAGAPHLWPGQRAGAEE